MLDAISPVDGRYRRHTASLSPWMSEFGLIHHRVEVEVEYFLALVAMPLPQLADFPQDKVEPFREVYRAFSQEDAQWVKDKERVTNHDVKLWSTTSRRPWSNWAWGRGRNLSTLA